MTKRVVSSFSGSNFSLSNSSLSVALALVLTLAINLASATAAQIVAFGASNTAGHGVGSDQAWPARLEAMLRAEGYQATVTNAGISGDTTAGMLERLDTAVPDGTELVIVAIFPYNDNSHGVSPAQHEANIEKILGRLHARGLKTISAIPYVSGLPTQSDGIHLTAEAHATLAARLLPQVIAVIGRR
jgi:acyl-CoA thioesterase I